MGVGRRTMRRIAAFIAVIGMLAFPAVSPAGGDEASACGQYHGWLGKPPVGGLDVAASASSGALQNGVVGERNSNPACHS
jgi:hypothetical protein